jgi:peptidoglycan/xylan/chitin deacetylase (PgdA/CDA1 family)
MLKGKAVSDRLRILIAACFYYSGLVKLIRCWTARSGPSLIILNYHRASGGDLHSHLLYLRSHYRILHLEAALEKLFHTPTDGETKKNRLTMLALTFDDGYYDNFTHAFNIACELQIPLTIFLIPGYVENGQPFWWLEGMDLVNRASKNEMNLEGKIYHINQNEEREALVQAITDRVLHAGSVSEREEFLRSMRKSHVACSPLTYDQRLALPLNWTEVHEMAKSGLVSFGAHTMHHPALAYLDNPAELLFEIEQCRTILEQQLGHPVHTFAYPLGKPEYIGDRALQFVRQACYKWAVTTIPGINTSRSDPLLLRRRNVGVNQHWLVVASETAGIWGGVSRLYRWTFCFFRKAIRKAKQS